MQHMYFYPVYFNTFLLQNNDFVERAGSHSADHISLHLEVTIILLSVFNLFSLYLLYKLICLLIFAT